MSDQTPKADGTTTADPLLNFKSEMDRKLKSQDDSLKQLTESLKALNAQLMSAAKPQAPAAQESGDDIDELWYSKPAVAAQKIKEQTKNELRREMEEQNAVVQKRNSVLSQLVQEYPELNNNSSSLTQKAVEIYNSLPPEEQSRPMAYRLAVKEAAAELGVKPLSKREDQDFYSVGNSGGSAPTPRKKEAEISEATEAFAKIMGVDINKVKERTKSRKNWNRYE